MKKLNECHCKLIVGSYIFEKLDFNSINIFSTENFCAIAGGANGAAIGSYFNPGKNAYMAGMFGAQIGVFFGYVTGEKIAKLNNE